MDMKLNNYPRLKNTQAHRLAGKEWVVGGVHYWFNPQDSQKSGHRPWRSGSEALAYPLLNSNREIVAYFKSFKRPSQQRYDRTQLLVELNLAAAAPILMAAPNRWVDTRPEGRPKTKEIDFDFCGSLMPAVPGQTWNEIKKAICDRKISLSREFKLRCIHDLVHGLSILEKQNIVHGDLSPGNVIINPNAGPDEPALYLIDFDAFVYQYSSGKKSLLSQKEGGTFGTDGYCPPELELKDDQDPTKHPFSDRFGRDMLIIELLAFGSATDHEKPPREWNHAKLQKRLQATIKQYETSANVSRLVERLMADDIFCCSEDARPTSEAIASQLGLDELELDNWIPLPVAEPAPPKSPARPSDSNGRKRTSGGGVDDDRESSVAVKVKSGVSPTSTQVATQVTPRSRRSAHFLVVSFVLFMAVWIWWAKNREPFGTSPLPPDVNHPPILMLIGDVPSQVESGSTFSVTCQVDDPDDDSTWIILASETPFRLSSGPEVRISHEIPGTTSSSTEIKIVAPKVEQMKSFVVFTSVRDEHGAKSNGRTFSTDVVPPLDRAVGSKKLYWPVTISTKDPVPAGLHFAIELSSIPNGARIFLEPGKFGLPYSNRKRNGVEIEITDQLTGIRGRSLWLAAPSSPGPHEISIYAIDEDAQSSMPVTKSITVVKAPIGDPPPKTHSSPPIVNNRTTPPVLSFEEFLSAKNVYRVMRENLIRKGLKDHWEYYKRTDEEYKQYQRAEDVYRNRPPPPVRKRQDSRFPPRS
jgi:serine/threonine protein kinase